MENDFYNDNGMAVYEELFAAWLDGTLSPGEESRFMDMAAGSEEIQELMEANDQTEETYENMMTDGYEMPEELQDDFELPYIGDNDDIEPYDGEPYDDDETSDDQAEADSCDTDTDEEDCESDGAQEDIFFI